MAHVVDEKYIPVPLLKLRFHGKWAGSTGSIEREREIERGGEMGRERERERAHVLDEKSIPASKIEVS